MIERKNNNARQNAISAKEIMRKYHCSMRTVRGLLMELAEDDERVYNEIELRRH